MGNVDPRLRPSSYDEQSTTRLIVVIRYYHRFPRTWVGKNVWVHPSRVDSDMVYVSYLLCKKSSFQRRISLVIYEHQESEIIKNDKETPKSSKLKISQLR